MRYVWLGRDNLRSHFVVRPRHAPEWLHARFLPVVFLTNEEELTGKTFTTSLNTTNPNTYVKFIFLLTSPLMIIMKAMKGMLHRHDKNPALCTWKAFFFPSKQSPFRFSVRHRPGRCNQNADSLSRLWTWTFFPSFLTHWHNFLVLSVLIYFYPFYLALFWITPEVAGALHAAKGKMGECEEAARVRGQLWRTRSPHVRRHSFSWALARCIFCLWVLIGLACASWCGLDKTDSRFLHAWRAG